MKTKTRVNLYYGEMVADKELDASLKKCFVNHLLVYNFSLGLLREDRDIDFKVLKDKVYNHVKEGEIKPVILPALMIELYYQHKKFKDGVKNQKLITDIQYFTVITNGYQNKVIDVGSDLLSIKVVGLPGSFTLSKKLPDVTDLSPLYFNVSYSNISDNYMLSIFKL